MNSSITEKIEFPDFNQVEEVCRKKIIEKFPKYKNSWKDDPVTLDWWGKRLNEEIKEIFTAKSVEEYVDEIPDAINILVMMYNNAVKKCSKCNNTVVSWHSIGGEIVCMGCYIS